MEPVIIGNKKKEPMKYSLMERRMRLQLMLNQEIMILVDKKAYKDKENL